MIMKKLLFNIILILGFSFLYGQVDNQTLDNAVKRISNNIVQKLKDLNEQTTQQIIVMPIKSRNDEITPISRSLTNKISHQTNLIISKQNLNFNVRVYNELEDTLVNRVVNEVRILPDMLGDEQKFHTNLLHAQKIDYIIYGNYYIDVADNRFQIENVKLLKNWKQKGELEIVSVQNVNVVNEQKYGAASVWRSVIVPGWGQLYKSERLKGFSILAAEGVFIGSFFIADNLSYNYYQKALNNRDSRLRKEYLGISDNWNTTRNIFGVLAAVVYVYNIVDVVSNKKDKYNVQNLHLYPYSNENTFGLTFKLKM